MDYGRYMDAYPHMREMMIWHTPYYPPFSLYLVYYVLPWIVLIVLSSLTFFRLSKLQKETSDQLSTNQGIVTSKYLRCSSFAFDVDLQYQLSSRKHTWRYIRRALFTFQHDQERQFQPRSISILAE